MRPYLLGLMVFVTACAAGPAQPQASKFLKAPKGQPTLEEYLDQKVPLPMAEATFIKRMKQSGLKVSKIGLPDLDLPVTPSPRYLAADERALISYGYSIDGGYDRKLGRQERFIAYADQSGLIFYVETWFAFKTIF